MKKILIIFAVFATLNACKVDFGDYNKNPLGPNEIEPTGLFGGGVMNFFNNGGRPWLSQPAFYVQWLRQGVYTSEMQYADQPVDWDPWFIGVLSNFKQNIDYLNENYDDPKWNGLGGVDNLIAVNKIMYAYVFKIVTDIYGDIPYSEALDKNNLAPKYDDQIDIYVNPDHGLIKILEEARDALSPGQYPISGDIVYGGSAVKWRKLANSLIMHTALQLSDISDANVQNYIRTAFNNALNDGPIDNVRDDAWIFYNDYSSAYQNPWSRFRKRDYYITKEFSDALHGDGYASTSPGSCSPTYNTNIDPRLYVYVNIEQDDLGNYLYDGEPYSCNLPGEGAQMSGFLWDPNAPLPFFTAGWTYLDRAEAVLLGWSTEDFNTMLENGINAHIQSLEKYLDISEEHFIKLYGMASGTFLYNEYETYKATYAASRVADANNAAYGDPAVDSRLEVLSEEKWVAYFPMTFEGWSQWRKLDLPVLTPHPQALNNGDIPTRYKYPSTESTLNPSGYQSGVSHLNPAEDRNSSKVPWDVN